MSKVLAAFLGFSRMPHFSAGVDQLEGRDERSIRALCQGAPQEELGAESRSQPHLVGGTEGSLGRQAQGAARLGQGLHVDGGQPGILAEAGLDHLRKDGTCDGIHPRLTGLVEERQHDQSGRPLVGEIGNDAATQEPIQGAGQKQRPRHGDRRPAKQALGFQQFTEGGGYTGRARPLERVGFQHGPQQFGSARRQPAHLQLPSRPRDDGAHSHAPFPGEGMFAREQFPGQDAQGEDIAGGTSRLALDLLRGGVARAAHEGPGLGELGPGIGAGAFWPGVLRPGDGPTLWAPPRFGILRRQKHRQIGYRRGSDLVL